MNRAIERPRRASGIALSGFVMGFASLIAPASTQTGMAQPQSAPATANAAPPVAAGRFVTEQGPREWRGSKLIGAEIYTAGNERIGEVNEILVADAGNVVAVVLGVGGFLGLGEKNVAVPFGAIEWSPRTMTPAMQSARTMAGAPGEKDLFVQRGGDPQHGMLRLTRADLQAAPEFNYAGRSHRR